MKMPEKHDLLAAILAAKEQGIGATRVCNGVPSRADIMAVRLIKTVIDATMCAIIALVHSDLLDFRRTK